MAKLNIPISREAPSNTLQFNKYLNSGSWRCLKGGAHFWIPVEGDEWQCQKCHSTREFSSSECPWTEVMSARPWNMYRAIDILMGRT